MSLYKPRHRIQIVVPKNTTYRSGETVTIEPHLYEAEWARNNHLEADELRVTFDGQFAGLDVRTLRNARCSYWLWDDARESFDPDKHLRFTGIGSQPERTLDEKTDTAQIHFKDWTTLFIEAKRFPSDGVPEWTDTLKQAWLKICDNTGFWDPDLGSVVSSVEDLKYALVFSDPSLETMTLGKLAPDRLHAVSKPTPKKGASAWEVWQWCIQGVGLISYIDRDQVIVTRIQDHFTEESAPAFVYGTNILGLNEKADLRHASKGIILRSFDPLQGVTIEAHYPPPDDPRVKRPRNVAAKPGAKSKVTKDPIGDYEAFNWDGVMTQEALENRAREAYEERRRQELNGSVKLGDLFTYDESDRVVGSVLDLQPGDSIRVEVDRESRENYRSFDSDNERVAYLMSRGYKRDAAQLIVLNSDGRGQFDPIFHVGSLTTRMAENSLEIEIKYHNMIKLVNGTNA